MGLPGRRLVVLFHATNNFVWHAQTHMFEIAVVSHYILQKLVPCSPCTRACSPGRISAARKHTNWH